MKIKLFYKYAALISCAVGSIILSPRVRAETLLLCFPGSAGDTASAAPAVSLFTSAVSKKTGTKFSGEYHNSLPSCDAFVNNKKPAVALVSQSVLFARRNKWQITPLLSIKEKNAGRHLFTAVIPSSYDRADFPTGWTISGSSIDGTGFVKHLLEISYGQRATKKISFKSTSTLDAAAEALKKSKEAVILSPLESMSWNALPISSKFKNVWTSPDIGPPAVVVTSHASDKLKNLLVEALKSLPTFPEGKEALLSLRIEKFIDPAKVYNSKIYRRGGKKK